MSIKAEDGKHIIDFLKNSLKVDIPRDGFLAGQSVCTALLYLKGKQKEFFVNDLDIFLPENSLTRLERKGFSQKQNKMLHRMVGFNNQKSFFTNLDFNKKELRNNFSLDQELKKEIIKYQSKLKKENKKNDDDYQKDFINGLAYKIKRENTFFKEKSLKFSASISRRIFDTTRKGIFNYIYYYNEYITNNHYDYEYILKDFDINCTQIGICLRTQRIFYTKNFIDFYNTMVMKICKPDTPYHSIIRFFKKQKEFGFNNSSSEFESFYISNLLRYGIFSKKKNSKQNSSEKYNNYCFGDIYADKFKSSNIKDYFTLYSLKKQTDLIKETRKKNEDKFYDYNLYKLRNSIDKFDYIESGEHKEFLEKTFGGSISGYEDYIHVHLRRIMEEKQKEKMKTYSYKNPEIELLKEYKDIEKNVNSGDLNFKSYSLNRDLEVYNFYLSKNVNESIDVFKVKEINKIVNKNQYLKKFLYSIEDIDEMYEALKLTEELFNDDQISKSAIIHKTLNKNNYTLRTFKQGLMKTINTERNQYSQEELSKRKYKFKIPEGFSLDILNNHYKLKEQSLYQKMVLTPYKLGIKNNKYLILSLFSDKNNRITFILNVDKNKLYLNKYNVYTFNKNDSVANKKIIENNEKVAKKFISLNNIIVQK